MPLCLNLWGPIIYHISTSRVFAEFKKRCWVKLRSDRCGCTLASSSYHTEYLLKCSANVIRLITSARYNLWCNEVMDINSRLSHLHTKTLHVSEEIYPDPGCCCCCCWDKLSPLIINNNCFVFVRCVFPLHSLLHRLHSSTSEPSIPLFPHLLHSILSLSSSSSSLMVVH